MKFDPKFMDLDASISVFGERYQITGVGGGGTIVDNPSRGGVIIGGDDEDYAPIPFVGTDGGYYDLMPDGSVVPKG